MKDIISDYADVSVDLNFSQGPPGFYRGSGKRIFDVLTTVILLPIILPLIAVIWTIVRLQGGAGFYSQDRVGFEGRIFKCWKVRTMIPDAEIVLERICRRDPKLAKEWRKNQKLRNDPRVTRVGRFLRMTSFDELPQFWNVLCGDMSLVGPRPFMRDQEALYRDAGGVAYYKMRPAITGPWQVMSRGQTSFVERVKFDNDYWKNVSLTADLRIFWQTIGVVLRGVGQ